MLHCLEIPGKNELTGFQDRLFCHLLYIGPVSVKHCLLICVWYKNKGHFDQHATKAEKKNYADISLPEIGKSKHMLAI